MSVLSAFADGWRRIGRARILIIGVWLLNLAVALPLALAALAFARPGLADPAVGGVPLTGSALEFVAQITALGQSFMPAFAGVAVAAGATADAAASTAMTAALVSAGVANALLTLFLLGGVLDRLARDRATGPAGFFAACGVFLFRQLRLALLFGVAAALVIWPLLPDGQALRAALATGTAASPVNVAVQAWAVLLSSVVLAAIALVFDYARVRMVVEDRRSAIGALAAAWRFVRRQPAAAAGLYAINLGVTVIVAAGATLLPQRVDWDTSLLVLAAYLGIRSIVRLAWIGTHLSLFQGRLAHAGYTARPLPSWPDSPAADAIRPQ